MDEKKIKVIVITGPTASGKSAIALEIAEKLRARIISADSRQIYRGIPITTAAPGAADLARVPHHLVAFKDLEDYYSAAAFEEDALTIIRQAEQRGEKYIVVCGGSMMYVDALLYGLDELPVISDNVRQRVKDLFNQTGLEGVVALLDNLDPEYITQVDKDNPRRVMHAVELCLQTGRTVTELLSGNVKNRSFEYYKFVIERPRAELFDRINRRVDNMVACGMEEEARAVFHLRHLNSLNTIGFKEWFAYFDGKLARREAIDRIAKNTRVYAKKQMTWLARQSDNIYIEPMTAVHAILERCMP